MNQTHFNHQQHFFQQFFGPGGQNMHISTQDSLPVPEYITNNETVLEISNNWSFVRWMMYRYREGLLKQIDAWEQVWYNFITSNNIDVESFKNKQEFIQKYWKNPVI